VTWQPWPIEAVKPSYIVLGASEVPDVAGYVARVPVAPGEPLSDSKMVAPGDRGSMSAVLRPGMRAVSVTIAPETAASGLIMPGDTVDVLFASPVPALDPDGRVSATERAAAQTLLHNIHVLAIDQTIEAVAGRAIVGTATTVEVTPKEAEIM